MHSDYIVFVDESVDHSLTVIDDEYPLFVLCFCVVKKSDYADVMVPRIKRLKFETFGHDCVVLHESDIRRKRGAFAKLSKEPREAFMSSLTALIDELPLTVIAVVIDKRKLRDRYAHPYNPYHIGIQYGLERVRHFLRLHTQHETLTHVVCEARGAKEDKDLELAFRRVCADDNRSTAHYEFDIVLRPRQANRAYSILEKKFFTGAFGAVSGNGLKIFP